MSVYEDIAAELEFAKLREQNPIGSLKWPEMQVAIARAAIPVLQAGDDYSLEKARELFGHDTIKYVSTLTGKGQDGKGGLRLFKRDGSITARRINVAKLLAVLPAAERETIVTDSNFKEQFRALPE